MKKLLALVLLISTALAVYAQDGNLKKQTYLRIGYSLPSWKYFGNTDKSEWVDDAKRMGGVFEVGNIFMLNGIKLSPGMRLGINVDYMSVSYHRFSSKAEDAKENLVFIGSKIGPSFSYSPVDRLVFDAFFKFNPVWVAADIQTEGDEKDFFLGYMGIKYGFGLNVRYSVLMLGFEINPGFVKMKWFDDEENSFSDFYRGNDTDNGKKTNAPGINFTVGLSF
jgi:hypothetical protein